MSLCMSVLIVEGSSVLVSSVRRCTVWNKSSLAICRSKKHIQHDALLCECLLGLVFCRPLTHPVDVGTGDLPQLRASSFNCPGKREQAIFAQPAHTNTFQTLRKHVDERTDPGRIQPEIAARSVRRPKSMCVHVEVLNSCFLDLCLACCSSSSSSGSSGGFSPIATAASTNKSMSLLWMRT